MTDPAQTRPPRLKRWLVLSVALNLFLVGLIGGAVALGGPHKRGWRHAGGVSPHVLMRALPEERRGDAKAFFREGRAGFREARAEADEAKQAAMATLTVEPFDRAAYEAAQSAAISARVALRQKATKRMGAFLETLSPEERAAVANAVQERAERRKRRRDNKDQ